MHETDYNLSPLALEAERLKLERESIAVEKERLAAARMYAEAEAKLSRAHKPVSFFVASTLLLILAFVLGTITGFSVSEHQRDVRLRDTLARLDTLGDDDEGAFTPTNRTGRLHGRAPLSVTVIQ